MPMNFRANLDAQNAGNCICGLQKQSMPPDPPRDSCVVCRPHGYPPLIYYLTERSLIKNAPPPTGKSLKKSLIKSRTKFYICAQCKQSGRAN